MSGFLLDTNIPSETVKLRPEPRVTGWISQQPNPTLYLSAVSIGELRRGFVTLPQGPRRTRLEYWLENDVMLWFDQRILPVRRIVRVADEGLAEGNQIGEAAADLEAAVGDVLVRHTIPGDVKRRAEEQRERARADGGSQSRAGGDVQRDDHALIMAYAAGL